MDYISGEFMVDTLAQVVDTLSKAGANSSQQMAYFYFFSTTAQVFAAIFSVVIVAYTFRHSEMNKQLEALHSELKSRVFMYRQHHESGYMRDKLGLHISTDNLLGSPDGLDDYILIITLESIVKTCDDKIELGERGVPGIAPAEYQKIKTIISDTLKKSKAFKKKKSLTLGFVILPTVIAALLTMISLFALGIESLHMYQLVLWIFPIATLAVLIISITFIYMISKK